MLQKSKTFGLTGFQFFIDKSSTKMETAAIWQIFDMQTDDWCSQVFLFLVCFIDNIRKITLAMNIVSKFVIIISSLGALSSTTYSYLDSCVPRNAIMIALRSSSTPTKAWMETTHMLRRPLLPQREVWQFILDQVWNKEHITALIRLSFTYKETHPHLSTTYKFASCYQP